MRALSVRQPWASKIARGEKKIEWRGWDTKYRGPILICAGKQWYAGQTKPEGWRETHPLGVAVCLVDLVDVVPTPWTVKDPGAFGWHLANPRLVRPVEVKGQLGLFHVPDNIIVPAS